MRAKKTLDLPNPRDLRSLKLEDVQDFFRQAFDEIDAQWRKLHQDVTTIQIPIGEFFYLGDKDTLGTWRLGRDGADYVLEHQTTTIGTWVTVYRAKGS